jgi:hypothetical protein
MHLAVHQALALHEAFALCPGSVPVVGTVCNTVAGVAGQAASVGVDAVFSAAGRWVSSGAVWLIAEVGRVLSATTSIDLGSGWFTAHEAVMASLAAAVVVPMACCAAIQAVYRQSASMLMRTFLVNLPLCLLFTGVAVALVRVGLAVTDALSARVLSTGGVDTTNLFSGISAFFSGVGPAAPVLLAVPAFVVFIAGLLVAMAALVLWLELVVRAAAVSAAVLFLPLALAALVWPAVAHWCRRLADTIVALVLSKLVVAAVLSLAAGALAGGLGLSGNGDDASFSSVMIGIALLVIATLSPFTLLRLVPAVEAGAVAHLESARHRLQGAALAPVRTGGNLALDLVRGKGSGGSEGADGGAQDPVGSGGDAGSGVPAGVDGLVGSGAAGGTGTSAIPMLAGAALGPEIALAAGGAQAAGSAGAGATAGGAHAAAGGAQAVGGSGASASAGAAGGGARPGGAAQTRRVAEPRATPGASGVVDDVGSADNDAAGGMGRAGE